MNVTTCRNELNNIMDEIQKSSVSYSGDTSTHRLTRATVYSAILLDDNVKTFNSKSSVLGGIMIGLSAAMLIAVIVQVLIAKGCI